jgi:predicted nuclease of predicted toxin-antitoxin system
MRFLADENIARAIIERLRSSGLDVLAVVEETPAASDKDVLALAVAEQRIVITEDRDFGEMVIRQRMPVRGIILLELDPLPNAVAAKRVAEVIASRVDGLVGNLLIIEPGRLRIRPLPSPS